MFTKRASSGSFAAASAATRLADSKSAMAGAQAHSASTSASRTDTVFFINECLLCTYRLRVLNSCESATARSVTPSITVHMAFTVGGTLVLTRPYTYTG